MSGYSSPAIPPNYLWKVSPFHTGGFGSIFLAEHPNVPNNTIVIKAVSVPESKSALWSVRMEVEALRRIQNCPEPTNYIVEQPCTGGLAADCNIWWSKKDATVSMLFKYYPQTLRNVCVDYGRVVEAGKLRNIVFDVVCGLSYLHRLGIIHNDIKPDNIFLDEYGICKIGDLGGALVLPDAKALDGRAIKTNDSGTRSYDYIAPELVYKGPTAAGNTTWCYDQTVDFWALGMMVFELATGAVMRWIENVPNAPDRVLVAPQRLPALMWAKMAAMKCDGGVIDFVHQACEYNPAHRLRWASAKHIVDQWESCDDPYDYRNRFTTPQGSLPRYPPTDDGFPLPMPPTHAMRTHKERNRIAVISARFEDHLRATRTYIPEISDYRYLEVHHFRYPFTARSVFGQNIQKF